MADDRGNFYGDGERTGRGLGLFVIRDDTSDERCRQILDGFVREHADVLAMAPSLVGDDGDLLVDLGDDVTEADLDDYQLGVSDGFWDEVLNACVHRLTRTVPSRPAEDPLDAAFGRHRDLQEDEDR